MVAAGARRTWVRALTRAATAAAGTMVHARPFPGPGVGSPLLFPGVYVLALVLAWLVHITV